MMGLELWNQIYLVICRVLRLSTASMGTRGVIVLLMPFY